MLFKRCLCDEWCLFMHLSCSNSCKSFYKTLIMQYFPVSTRTWHKNDSNKKKMKSTHKANLLWSPLLYRIHAMNSVWFQSETWTFSRKLQNKWFMTWFSLCKHADSIGMSSDAGVFQHNLNNFTSWLETMHVFWSDYLVFDPCNDDIVQIILLIWNVYDKICAWKMCTPYIQRSHFNVFTRVECNNWI